jgi:hypothetical protein
LSNSKPVACHMDVGSYVGFHKCYCPFPPCSISTTCVATSCLLCWLRVLEERQHWNPCSAFQRLHCRFWSLYTAAWLRVARSCGVSEIGWRFDDHEPVKRQLLEKKDFAATEKGIAVLQD